MPTPERALRRLIRWGSSTAIIVEQAATLLHGVARGEIQPDDPRLIAFGALALAALSDRPEELEQPILDTRRLQRAVLEALFQLEQADRLTAKFVS